MQMRVGTQGEIYDRTAKLEPSARIATFDASALNGDWTSSDEFGRHGRTLDRQSDHYLQSHRRSMKDPDW